MLLLVVQSLFSMVIGRLLPPSHTVCGSNACYTAHLDRTPFHQALERCKANGGNLATAKDAEEALLIQELLSAFPAGLRPNTKSKFWLGLQLLPRHCYQRHKPLRGFGWTSGGEETGYSNWAREPRGTCTAHRCVHIVSFSPIGSSSGGENYKWLDGVCSHGVDGYLCKFSFKGMCPQISLSGPGSVTYSTPFNAESSSLALIPFGSLAVVSCAGIGSSPVVSYMLCIEQDPDLYGWSTNEPFCAPFGCDLDNGGCAQICVSAGGRGYRCQCGAGYRLGDDQRSCEPQDHCQGHPCQYRCVSQSLGFECVCPAGYQLTENGTTCVDTDECAQRPCAQVCINTPGSFRCVCSQGYALVAGQCRDLDECSDHPCDQVCQNTGGSYRCQCKAGYRLQGAGHSCVDLNECLTRPCEGACSNNEGSFECTCSEGHTLGEDRVSCFPTGLATTLIATVQQSGTTAGDWGPTTPGALVDHATGSSTTDASSGIPTQSENRGDPTTGVSVAADTSAAGCLHLTSSTEVQTLDKGSSPSLSWMLKGALGSVAALLLILCVVGLILCLRYRSPKQKSNNAGDYYSWVQAAGQSPFGASYVKCNRSSDNYIDIEASQTEINTKDYE